MDLSHSDIEIFNGYYEGDIGKAYCTSSVLNKYCNINEDELESDECYFVPFDSLLNAVMHGAGIECKKLRIEDICKIDEAPSNILHKKSLKCLPQSTSIRGTSSAYLAPKTPKFVNTQNADPCITAENSRTARLRRQSGDGSDQIPNDIR